MTLSFKIMMLFNWRRLFPKKFGFFAIHTSSEQDCPNRDQLKTQIANQLNFN